jgi:predicted cupin superfamily sugar epimerase
MVQLNNKIELLIQELNLIPHPEGGFYRETYRSKEVLNDINRNLVTTIYFLLRSEDISLFHRIKSDEHWFFHAGSRLVVHTLDKNGHHKHLLGLELNKGETPHFIVPKNTIFGSQVLEKNSYSLVSCLVSPGFDFADFELIKRVDLLKEFPEHKEIIEIMGMKKIKEV